MNINEDMISIDIEGSIPEHWFLGAQPMIKISEPHSHSVL